MSRIDELAQPSERKTTPKFDPHSRDWSSGVRKGALEAVVSERVMGLAAPRWRTRKYRKVRINASGVTKLALNAKASERCCSLALPRWKTSKYMEPDRGPSVNPNALTAKCTQRIDNLALSMTSKLRDQLNTYKDVSELFRAHMQVNIGKSEQCIYSKMYHTCKPDATPPPPKRSYLYRKEYKPPPEVTREQQKVITKKWLETAAKPKKEIKPPPIVREKKPLKKMLRHLTELAVPKHVELKLSKRPKIFEGINPSCFTYVATPHLKKMAVAKVRIEPSVNTLGIIPLDALSYQASRRIKSMSKPKPIMFAPNTHVKDNPYGVEPGALTANCSKRIKSLALPKSYGDPPNEKEV